MTRPFVREASIWYLNVYENGQKVPTVFSPILTTIMVGKIKLFSYIRNSFERVGINPPKTNQNQLISSKNVFFLIYNTQIFISMVISCVTSATSFFELALSFYLCTTTFVITLLYVLSILHCVNIHDLIENYEQFIEKSKLK